MDERKRLIRLKSHCRCADLWRTLWHTSPLDPLGLQPSTSGTAACSTSRDASAVVRLKNDPPIVQCVRQRVGINRAFCGLLSFSNALCPCGVLRCVSVCVCVCGDYHHTICVFIAHQIVKTDESLVYQSTTSRLCAIRQIVYLCQQASRY